MWEPVPAWGRRLLGVLPGAGAPLRHVARAVATPPLRLAALIVGAPRALSGTGGVLTGHSPSAVVARVATAGSLTGGEGSSSALPASQDTPSHAHSTQGGSMVAHGRSEEGHGKATGAGTATRREASHGKGGGEQVYTKGKLEGHGHGGELPIKGRGSEHAKNGEAHGKNGEAHGGAPEAHAKSPREEAHGASEAPHGHSEEPHGQGEAVNGNSEAAHATNAEQAPVSSPSEATHGKSEEVHGKGH